MIDFRLYHNFKWLFDRMAENRNYWNRLQWSERNFKRIQRFTCISAAKTLLSRSYFLGRFSDWPQCGTIRIIGCPSSRQIPARSKRWFSFFTDTVAEKFRWNWSGFDFRNLWLSIQYAAAFALQSWISELLRYKRKLSKTRYCRNSKINTVIVALEMP